MTDADQALWRALDDWRSSKTEEFYGWSSLIDFGPTLVMPGDILERIVHCAHHFKITTLAELKKETQWDEADAWGHEVIKIISQIFPPPVPTPLMTILPIHPLSQSLLNGARQTNPPAQKERAQSHCGACHKPGHNRTCNMHLIF
jgi:hypothetical protein